MKTLGKAKKLAKAEAKLAKLKAKEVGYTRDLQFNVSCKKIAHHKVLELSLEQATVPRRKEG